MNPCHLLYFVLHAKYLNNFNLSWGFMVGRAGNMKSARVYSALCSNMLKLKWLMAVTMCVVIAAMEKELLNRLPRENVS